MEVTERTPGVPSALRPEFPSGLSSLTAATVHGLRNGLRLRRGHDKHARETFDTVHGDRGCVVAADDGVPLLVREAGPSDAPITAIFVHGFTLSMDSWHFQRTILAEKFGDEVRLVFSDLRGHGRSGAAPKGSETIEQLAMDLGRIIDATAPHGQIVLIGHSMGGMALMAFARLFPDFFGRRVSAVAFVATAASSLTDHGIAAMLNYRLIAGIAALANRLPMPFHYGRKLSTLISSPIIRAASYGDLFSASPSVAEFSESIINSTSVETVSGFIGTFVNHDEQDALPSFSKKPVVIICGDKDIVTPLARSQEIAERLPSATLVVVPDSGHMVQLEQPELVSSILGKMITDISPARKKRAPSDSRLPRSE